jgi:hypothetical protein
MRSAGWQVSEAQVAPCAAMTRCPDEDRGCSSDVTWHASSPDMSKVQRLIGSDRLQCGTDMLLLL